MTPRHHPVEKNLLSDLLSWPPPPVGKTGALKGDVIIACE
jgi:hypothetical protein